MQQMFCDKTGYYIMISLSSDISPTLLKYNTDKMKNSDVADL